MIKGNHFSKKIQRSNKGFSLLEVLLSMSLFGIAGITMAQAFSHQLAFNTNSEIRSGAIMAAQQVLDDYRMEDPNALPLSGSEAQNITIGSKTYNTMTYFCETAAYCASASVRQLRTEVRYNSRVYYNIETIYAQLR